MITTSILSDAATASAGLLVGRAILGGLMAAHGSQKLLGWFGGYGLAGTGGFFESLGFRPGRLFAGAAAVSEVAGGLLIALGLLGPVGPALVLSVMIVAAVTVHLKQGLFASNNGIEVPLLYGAGAVALALTGYGAFSLDAALGLSGLWTSALVWTVLGLGAIGGFGMLVVRKQPAVATA
jgi:putative oxidoreductase